MRSDFGRSPPTSLVAHLRRREEGHTTRSTAASAPHAAVHSRLRSDGWKWSTVLKGHFGCVNAIEWSRQGTLLASGGDDQRVLLRRFGDWESQSAPPLREMRGHISNIFSVSFSVSSRSLVSCGNDNRVILYDVEGGTASRRVFHGHTDSVFKARFLDTIADGQCVFASAGSHDAWGGDVRIWDSRTHENDGCVRAIPFSGSAYAVVPHPCIPSVLFTASAAGGVEAWDLRMVANRRGREVLRSVPLCRYRNVSPLEVNGVEVNKSGTLLIASYSEGYPVLLSSDLVTLHPLAEFRAEGYRNENTLKSPAFVGLEDEYVASGSDDYCVYCWEVPRGILRGAIPGEVLGVSESTATPTAAGSSGGAGGGIGGLDPSTSRPPLKSERWVLCGHASVPNNVAQHPTLPLFATSGVEKSIRLWSPFSLSKHFVDASGADADPLRLGMRSWEELMVLMSRNVDDDDVPGRSTSTDESLATLAMFERLRRQARADSASTELWVSGASESEDDSSEDHQEGSEASGSNGPHEFGDHTRTTEGGGDAS